MGMYLCGNLWLHKGRWTRIFNNLAFSREFGCAMILPSTSSRAQPHIIGPLTLAGCMVSAIGYIVKNTYVQVPSHLWRVLCDSSTWLLVFG